MAKRESRKKIVKKVNTAKPLTALEIMKFGSDDDPCFGKLHDPTQDECKRCGDCTLCQIVLDQKTKGLRANEEKGGRYKDMELGENPNKEIEAYVKAKLKRGYSPIKLKKRVMEKFNIDKDTARQIIKSNK